MAAIDIENVVKDYSGQLRAVNDVSIAVLDGEFIVLVGPSGCGKSTLLRMVAGLESITAGTIRIGERVVNDVDPADRDIAMVFQNYALYPHMTVRANMAYALKNRGTPRAEIERKVQEVAETLQLSAFLNRKPRQLSGGQRKRVAMGRAIIRDPAAFLFDEPLSNLDAKLRVQMRGEIKQLQRRLGTTSLYVTHDQMEAMTLADRLVVLNGGVVEQIGRPLEVYKNPASTFVAEFIGSPAMNMLQAPVADRKARIGNHDIALAKDAPVNGKITIGFRAEDAKLVDGDRSTLALKVGFIEELGSERLVHGHFEDHPITVSMPSDQELGDTVPVYLDPRHIHLFDPETGRRISS
ncbi:MAG: sn-glycerol-3-phosphate ABC transporter ATP-binding protein UgpC [Geminicoccaceae bacterium]